MRKEVKSGGISLHLPEKESLSEQIANELKRQIGEGEIPPGTHVKEAEIADSLGISRAPVREAINLLLSEGILEKEPYRGVFVYVPSKEDRENILEARILVETYAVDKLAKHSDPDTLDNLERLIEKIQNEAKSKRCDWRKLMVLDMAFHETLCKSSQNELLVSIWKSLMLKQRVIFMMDCANGGRIDIIADEHVQIYDALASNNVSEAKALLLKHINSCVDSYPGE